MQKQKLIVQACFESLDKIRDYFSHAAREAGFNDDAVFEVEVAVDEAASNIIDHAYQGECQSEIECDYHLLPDGLQLTLHDHGKPFDRTRSNCRISFPIPPSARRVDWACFLCVR